MVEGEGFEPSKAEPSDLQSDPFDRSGTPPLAKTAWILSQDLLRVNKMPLFYKENIGAGARIRTGDLLITNQLLYQLSYASNTYNLSSRNSIKLKNL